MGLKENLILLYLGLLVIEIQGLLESDLIDRSRVNVETSYKLGIFNGKKTTIKQHPYLVSLVQNGSSFCAGTIINENWILTNGDCTKNRGASDITVVSGSNDGVSGTSHSVSQVVPHPSYGKVHLDYDYACLQIQGSFTWGNKVRAAVLPSKPVQDYTWLTVAGYGSQNTVEGSANNALLQGKLQWLNKDVCQTMLSSISLSWSDRFACAYNAGDTTLCKGDFGDALVVDNTVYGIFTAGVTKNFCTQNSMPNIFADVFTVLDWIKTTTGA